MNILSIGCAAVGIAAFGMRNTAINAAAVDASIRTTSATPFGNLRLHSQNQRCDLAWFSTSDLEWVPLKDAYAKCNDNGVTVYGKIKGDRLNGHCVVNHSGEYTMYAECNGEMVSGEIKVKFPNGAHITYSTVKPFRLDKPYGWLDGMGCTNGKKTLKNGDVFEGYAKGDHLLHGTITKPNGDVENLAFQDVLSRSMKRANAYSGITNLFGITLLIGMVILDCTKQFIRKLEARNAEL